MVAKANSRRYHIPTGAFIDPETSNLALQFLAICGEDV
jgi:hypothetical protein